MKRLYLEVLLVCAVIAASIGDVRAAISEPRIALVVGNSAYRNAPPLKNPVNDARDMAKALRELSFEVIEVENASKQQIEHAIGQFSAKLTEGSVGLFYYSGHGIQTNGHNFLIPVDAELATEAAVRLETIDLDILLDLMNMAQTRVNLVILDACRSNPFERRFRALGRGLAPVEQAPRGTLVAYSTAPGKVASDGDGANGLYTAELLKAIRQPGLTVEQVFKKVRIAVSTASNDNQTPWESSSLIGDFFFKPSAPMVAAPPPAPAINPDAADIAFWNSVKDETQLVLFEDYLKQFPNGRFADLAKYKIATLTKPLVAQAPQTATASPQPAPTPTSNTVARTPPQTAVLPPPAAPIAPGPPPTSTGPSASDDTAFHCPRPDTIIETSNGGYFRFMSGDGFRCYYRDRGDLTQQRFAVFAAGNGDWVDKGIDKLWPMKIGNEVAFDYCNKNGCGKESYRVIRSERVTVQAGSFDTFVIEWHEVWRQYDATRTYWFAPALGVNVKSTFHATIGQPADARDWEATKVTTP